MHLCLGSGNVLQEMPWYRQDGRTVLAFALQVTVSFKSRAEKEEMFHQYLPLPFASAGAMDGHVEHNLDEQGMSLRK